MFRTRKVSFASIGTQTKRFLDGRFCQCQARGRMVESKRVQEVMSVSELAICLKERWIMRDGQVQQVSRLQQIGSCTAKTRHRKKISGPVVKIESSEIGRRRSLNSQFLSRRNFCVKLLSNFLRDLALDEKYVF